ncbi:hypothetical protein SAMN06295888_13216 [Desulfonatronum zhilinae]|nr:hypothetical protein SAMN06295888_13216 [Desulfonatronum zhilinae]
MERRHSDKMERFTFQLPHEMKNKAIMLSKAYNISLGHFMRKSLETQIEKIDVSKNTFESSRDTFFTDHAVFHGDCPSDISANHDQYLYHGDV